VQADKTVSAVAQARARQALAEAGFPSDGALVPLRNVTNEVWLTEQHMIRLNRRHDARLRKEMAIAQLLPDILGYPAILAYGGEEGDDHLVTERPSGQVLAHAWPSLTGQQRHAAVIGLAEILQAVHSVRLPLDIPPIADPPLLESVSRVSPTENVVAALALIARHAHIDDGVLTSVQAMVRDLTLALEPFESPTMIHGDLHFENVLWDGHRVSGLLDFKWARPAPIDLELDVLLRYCSLPFIYVDGARRKLMTAEAHAQVPWQLADAYPALFSSARQFDRMRVFSIAHDVRELLLYPPPLPVDQLPEHHPYCRLVRMVRGESHLDHLARATVA
jgi:aminoglycoside phosphotransferase (APT) family kinase protein